MGKLYTISETILSLILFFSQSQWYYCNCTPSFIFEINKSKKWNFVLLLMSLSQIVYLFIGFKWWTCSFKFINQIWNFNNPCWNHWFDLWVTRLWGHENSVTFCFILIVMKESNHKRSKSKFSANFVQSKNNIFRECYIFQYFEYKVIRCLYSAFYN